MKWKMVFLTTALLTILTVAPAHALEYTVTSPGSGDFGSPTSDNTIYVGTENTDNVDRSKNSALIPPGFGSPTSYLPNSGEYLTPNLAASGSAVTVSNPSTGTVITTAGSSGGGTVYPGAVSATGSSTIYPGVTDTPSAGYPVTGFTSVTSDLYYSGGHLGTLKIPAIGLKVKVYQGTDSKALAKGAGHFTDTSIWEGNVALAGHNRGVTNHFGKIHTLAVGDTITFTTQLGTRTYSVASVSKISETDNSMLEPTSSNCITLFTCVQNERDYRWCIRAVEQ